MILATIFVLLITLGGYGVYRFLNPFGKLVNEELSDSYFYTRDGEGIVFSPMGNWFSLGKHDMKVDMATFQVLGRDYAKDKEYAYFKSKIIDFGIDVASFRVKANYVPMDKNHVYILTDNYYHIGEKGEGFKVFEDADPETYEQLNYDFAKDKNFIFRNEEKFTKVDHESFAVISDQFCKDINGVYLVRYQQPLYKIDANISEAVALVPSYIRDDKYVYIHTKDRGVETKDMDTIIRIPFKKPEEIQFYNDNTIVKIDNSIYYQGIRIEEADALTFEEVGYGYSKDASFVFFLGQIVEGADAKTFKYNDNNYTFSDKKHTYEGGKVVGKSKKW